MSEANMTSSRPYLIRALYEWLLDNHCTPHLVVDATDERVIVPRESVKDGQIVLNINPSAIANFTWDNELVAFSARFGGVPRNISVPMWAVLAIYARENGEGMAFGPATPPAELTEVSFETENPAAALKPRSGLKAVSTESASAEKTESKNETESDPKPSTDDDPKPPKGGKKRGGLRVVK